MHVESRVPGQPLLHHRVLVRGVVVGDQVQRLVLGRLAVDLAQELQPLDVGVVLLALPDDTTVQHIERGKQRGRAIALVVVRHRARSALLHRQPGLRAVQRLHLALLVTAQHQRVLGWRHVQAHDVFELLDELGVTRDLEAAHEMRLEPVLAPVARDAGRADPELLGHGARAPVGGRLGLALRRQFHQPRHVHLDRRRAAGKVALDAFKTRLEIALPPARDLNASDVQRQRDVLVL